MGERAKRLSKKTLGIVASLALAIGLMPLPVAAFTAESALAADPPTYTVTVVDGTASPAEAAAGETVRITANEPEAGKVFVQSDDNNLNLKETGWSEATFEMPATDVTLTAIFKEIIIDKISPQTYTGYYIEPTLKVSLDGVDIHLKLDADYRVTYKNNREKGTAEAIVEFQNHRTGSRTATFDINPADISKAKIEVTGLVYGDKPSPTVTWNDQTLKEGRDYTLTLSNTRVGKARATIEGKGNFEGSKESDEFTIAQRPLTITAKSDTRAYDGTPLTADYTSEGLAEGDKISSATVEGSQTDVGSSPNVVSEAKIVNAKGEDVTDCYDITYEKGTLTVEPAEATITVADASKVAGEADPAFTGTVTGLVKDGDLGEIKYSRTNKDEAVGTYKDVLDTTYTENGNYNVAVTKGSFTIKAKLTAVWLDGDGSVLQAKTYGEGDPIPAYDGKTPTKAGTAQYSYTFTSWDDGTVEGTTTTFKPLFKETVNKYTVEFVNDDGTVLQSGQVAYGEKPKYAGKTPAKAADARYTYEFKGWAPEIAAVTGDATYKATYAQTARKYTVEFVNDDGTVLQSGRVAYGEKPEYAGKAPTKAADAQYTYEFKGWTPEIAAVTGDATYKATYNATPIPAKKGTLTFDLAGGTLDGKTGRITIEANVGDTIEIPKAPTRAGYTFKYWKGSEYKPGDKYTVEGDHTFTAVWEKNSTGGSTTSKTTPKTGDDNGTLVIVVSVVAVASLGAVALSVWRRRSKR